MSFLHAQISFITLSYRFQMPEKISENHLIDDHHEKEYKTTRHRIEFPIKVVIDAIKNLIHRSGSTSPPYPMIEMWDAFASLNQRLRSA